MPPGRFARSGSVWLTPHTAVSQHEEITHDSNHRTHPAAQEPQAGALSTLVALADGSLRNILRTRIPTDPNPPCRLEDRLHGPPPAGPVQFLDGTATLRVRPRILQGPDPGQSRQLGGPRLPVARPAHDDLGLHGLTAQRRRHDQNTAASFGAQTKTPSFECVGTLQCLPKGLAI